MSTVVIQTNIAWFADIVADNAYQAANRTRNATDAHTDMFITAARDTAMSIDVDALGFDDILNEIGCNAAVVRDAEPEVFEEPHLEFTMDADARVVHVDGIEYKALQRRVAVSVTVTRVVVPNVSAQQAQHIWAAIPKDAVTREIDETIRSRVTGVLEAAFDGRPGSPINCHCNVNASLYY